MRDAVFEGDGVSVPASDSVIGKDIKIDTKTGDVATTYISILNMKQQKETFLKPYSLG